MMTHDAEFDLDRFLSYLENLDLNPPRYAPVERSAATSGSVLDDHRRRSEP